MNGMIKVILLYTMMSPFCLQGFLDTVECKYLDSNTFLVTSSSSCICAMYNYGYYKIVDWQLSFHLDCSFEE